MFRREPEVESEDYRIHVGEAGTNNDFGISVYLDRTCEYVVHRSLREISWVIEKVQCVFICVDWDQRYGTETSRTIRFRWRSTYKPFLTGIRLDDLFELRVGHVQIEASKVYSPDRVTFGDRLIPLVAESWKRSWELYHDAHYGPRRNLDNTRFRLPWWPVCIWMHKRPEVAYDLLESGELVPRPDGLGVDEARLLGEGSSSDGDMPPPPPAERLEVVEADTERVTLRWLASRGASGYQIEWSGDGEDFRVLEIMEGDEIVPDKDGWVTFKDYYNVETKDESKQHTHHYRVLACAGDLKDNCATSSNTVRLILAR